MRQHALNIYSTRPNYNAHLQKPLVTLFYFSWASRIANMNRIQLLSVPTSVSLSAQYLIVRINKRWKANTINPLIPPKLFTPKGRFILLAFHYNLVNFLIRKVINSVFIGENYTNCIFIENKTLGVFLLQ